MTFDAMAIPGQALFPVNIGASDNIRKSFWTIMRRLILMGWFYNLLCNIFNSGIPICYAAKSCYPSQFLLEIQQNYSNNKLLQIICRKLKVLFN